MIHIQLPPESRGESDWTNVNCVQAGDAKKTPGNDIRAAQPTGKESVHAWFLFALQTKPT